MNEEAAQEKLARTLGEAWITAGPRAWEEQSEARRAGARHLAGALLPVVRELIAEELQETANELTWDGLLHAVDYAGYAANLIRARAGALTTGDVT
jgi:hypothetical protein